MYKIGSYFLLDVTVYSLFAVTILLASFSSYRVVTTVQERTVHRTKVIKQFEDRKKNVVERTKKSSLQRLLEQAGFKRFNAYHYLIVRFVTFGLLLIYYGVIPYLQGGSYDIRLLIIPLVFYLITEPTFPKFCLPILFLNALIERRMQRKYLELFTLFDILKADLSSLGNGNEVNVYTLLKGSLPMFKDINGTITTFLSKWRTKPEEAKEAFSQDIGGESAKALGEILSKVDSTSKEQALKILESESSVFASSYYEQSNQMVLKRRTKLNVFFIFTTLLIFVWMIVFFTGMYNESIMNNNL